MKYFFKNSNGLKLAARLISPKTNGPFATVVFSHGFDSGKDSPRSVPLAQALAGYGIASFLIDFTGHGESEGSKEESTVEQQTDDLKSALDFCQSLAQIDSEKLALHGSSSGCLVILNLCLTDKRVKTAVLRAPRTNGYFPVVRQNASKLTIPMYFIQGEYDPLLPDTNDFFDLFQTEAELVVIPNANHLFTNPDHLDEVIDLSVNWFVSKLKMQKAA